MSVHVFTLLFVYDDVFVQDLVHYVYCELGVGDVFYGVHLLLRLYWVYWQHEEAFIWQGVKNTLLCVCVCQSWSFVMEEAGISSETSVVPASH